MAREISRRTVLRGLGTAMSLPLLDAMIPTRAFASTATAPVRMGFFFFPNGANMEHWTPKKVGDDFEFGLTLSPLKNVREHVTVISGLTHHHARANGDGPGDHARSCAAFLTGAQPRKTDGKDIRCGISVDQLAAQKIGQETRLPSLELGLERGAQSGNCDSGYSCAYSSSVSWRSPTTPMAKEVNPRLVFERLFGDVKALVEERDRAKQAIYRRSVLDLVQDDAKNLRGQLGGVDKNKLEEYLEAVRAVEKQIQAAERSSDAKLPPGVEVPEGIPAHFPDYIRLMTDLMILAYQTDTTRIVTFMLANDGSNRTFPWIDVRDGHHSISHHQRDSQKLDNIRKIDQYYVSQAAAMLEKMKTIKEGDGTLLDHVLIAYGCAIGDGNRHNHDELPVFVAGKGGGAATGGRHIRVPSQTPMCNLFVSMLETVGVNVDQFGDSKGKLTDLHV